jgi:ComF family protein
MTSLLAHVGRLATDLVFPPRCAICGAGGSFLCDSCENGLSIADGPRCSLCWKPQTEPFCGKCATQRPAFDGLRSLYRFDGGARELVHALKYRHQSALAEPMAGLLALFLIDDPLSVDLIVPVPLSKRRERMRGYNQSALLARGLSRRLGISVQEKALFRRRNTASQARTLSAEERRANVRDAFAGKPDLLNGRRVLLIDDVATTGATLDACARAALDSGAASVRALTFARED